MTEIRTTEPRAATAEAPAAGPVAGEETAPYLSIVIPAYQERDTIGASIRDVVTALSERELSFEVNVVDDGSTDGTAEEIRALAAEHPDRVRLITHPYNKGNGASVRTGIRAARGEVIACMDADGQHDPRDLDRMLPLMDRYDLVIGSRRWAEYRGGWHRNLANRFYNRLASRLTGFPIEDLTSGFRLFRASVVRRFVDLFPARFSYPTTSTLAFIKAGYNVAHVDINARSRQGTTSKISVLRDGYRFLLIIFKIVVLFEPLRVFAPSAAALFVLGIASSIESTIRVGRLHIPNSGVTLFVVSVLVILLGLMAEQLAALQVMTRDSASGAAPSPIADRRSPIADPSRGDREPGPEGPASG